MDYFELLQLPAKVDLTRLEIDKQYRNSFALANNIEDSLERNKKLTQINTARQAVIDIRMRLKLLLDKAGIVIDEQSEKVPEEVLLNSFQMRENSATLQGNKLNAFIEELRDIIAQRLMTIQKLLLEVDKPKPQIIACYYSFIYDSKLLEDLSLEK